MSIIKDGINIFFPSPCKSSEFSCFSIGDNAKGGSEMLSTDLLFSVGHL